MKVERRFNPYKVFQGAFAPYWILEHRGISAGAKLCHIRLLGFAGRDARCYPSLETLGAGLGVSDRQARDNVKELERAGLITVDQRGLRKTNVYLFLWTPELDQLLGGVPDRPSDPGDGESVGLPEKETLDEWAGILLGQRIEEASDAEGILDRAVAAVNRTGQWRSWNSLTLQIQIAAEQSRPSTTAEVRPADQTSDARREETPSDWKVIKSRIRGLISEIAYLNSFDETRQVERRGAALVVAVPDEATAAYITAEYEQILHAAAAAEEITQVRFVLPEGAESANPPNGIASVAVEAATVNTQATEVNSPAAGEGGEGTLFMELAEFGQPSI